MLCENKVLRLGSLYIKIFLKLKSLKVDKKKNTTTATDKKPQISENLKSVFAFLKLKYTNSKPNGSKINRRGVLGNRLLLINLTKLIKVSPTVKTTSKKIGNTVILFMGIKYAINPKISDIKQEIKNAKKLYLSAVPTGAVMQALPKTKSTDSIKKCLE